MGIIISVSRFQNFTNFAPGGMAEWSNAAVLKTVVRASGPGVRIPLPPHQPQNPDTQVSGFLFGGDRAKLA